MRLWSPFCLAALALAAVANAAPSDLDGVWLIEKSPRELRTLDGSAPPLLPAARTQYEAQKKLRAKGNVSFDHTSWCASAGVPRLMLEPYPFEILVNKRQVAFMYEWNRWARLVDMTGNNLEPVYPLSFGTANGHFEGDTLVIVSHQIAKETFLDASGLPHSDDLTFTERLRLRSPDVLESRMRIDDPETYAKPWEFVVTYRRQKDAGIREDVCLDRIKQGKPAIGSSIRSDKP